MVHSCTGVAAGLVLFVICWSGTFAVFAHEFDWLVTPQARVQPGAEQRSWDEWLQAVREAHPEAEIFGIEAPRYARSAATALIVDARGQSRFVYVDPYRATVLGDSSTYTLHRFLRNLHMSFFMASAGIYVVSVFALFLLLSMVSALYFYRRWWRRFLFMPRGRGHAYWSGLHRTTGLWSLLFVLLIGLTSVWYAAELLRVDVIDGKFSHAGAGDSAVLQIPAPASASAPALPLSTLLEKARAARPDLAIRQIGFGFYHEGALYLEGQAGHVLVRDRANQLHLDMQTGEVLYDQSAGRLPLYWRWSETADPLHFGDFAGLWSKSLWFLFGVMLCGLILTGAWLHAGRLHRDADQRYRWRVMPAALAASAGLFALAAYAGVDQAAIYGYTEDGVQRLPDLLPGVRWAMVSWLSLTLVIIGAWLWLLGRIRS
nr:PepSY-associated TM helix domain-containing protein [Wenzhouxiangella sp. XN24]